MTGPAVPPTPQHQRMPRRGADGQAKPELRFRGAPVSPGVAIGPVFGNHEPPTQIVHRSIQPGEAGAERDRLRTAIAASVKQLTKLRARLAVLPEDSQAEIAPLLEAYQRMLGPSRLVRGAERRIAQDRLAAETAMHEEAEAVAAAILEAGTQQSSEDRATVGRRAEEVREIARRVIRNLTRAPFRSFAGLPEGAVLICPGCMPGRHHGSH
jgi:phosphoenolpyruvate-protein kinase (PTS system EI component)